MVLRPVGLWLAAVLLASACGTDHRGGDVDAAAQLEDPSNNHPFFRLLRLSHVSPVPRTIEQMLADSTLVARAELVSVAEGRTIDFREGASHPIDMAVLHFEGTRVLKGLEQGSIYVEVIRGAVMASQLEEALPLDFEMLLVLRAPTWPEATYQFINARNGLPEGETLFGFVHPIGWMLQARNGVEYPLADDPEEPFFSADSLDAVENVISELVAVD
jgi:hypothetical protein